MHEITGLREPTDTVSSRFDDTDERRQANRAVGVSAIGLAATGLVELVIALITGSVGLLGDALHNLSDVSTSLVVFLGFRISRRAASERYPYGLRSSGGVSRPDTAPAAGREDRLLLLFTTALAVQRPPEDHQRYRRDDAEPYGQRDRPKPDEYPCDEGGEDHCDGCNPGV